MARETRAREVLPGQTIPPQVPRSTTASGRPRADFSFMARYGRAISKAGVAAIPTALFYYQGELGLKPEEVWFVCLLLSHRWTSDLPYPSLNKLAARSGVSINTLRRYKDRLAGITWGSQRFLEVLARRRSNGGYSSNAYDLSGLLGALEELVVRDSEVWFRGPLVGDGPGLADGEDGEIASPNVDNSVDKTYPTP